MRTRLIGGVTVLAVITVLLLNTGVGGGQTETTPVGHNAASETGRTPAPEYVTITFDDGYRSQYYAAQALEHRGMRGVFYIPVNQLNGSFDGIPTMTPAQVKALQVRGHEIGGHTFNHTDLSTLTTPEVRTSLEKNRAALQDMGINLISFAYPYGQGVKTYNQTVLDYYDTARTIKWGINTVPPKQPGALTSIALTEDNYHSLTNYLGRLQPGDWLIITLHSIDAGPVNRTNVDINQSTYHWILDRVAQTNATVVTFKQLKNREGY